MALGAPAAKSAPENILDGDLTQLHLIALVRHAGFDPIDPALFMVLDKRPTFTAAPHTRGTADPMNVLVDALFRRQVVLNDGLDEREIETARCD